MTVAQIATTTGPARARATARRKAAKNDLDSVTVTMGQVSESKNFLVYGNENTGGAPFGKVYVPRAWCEKNGKPSAITVVITPDC